MHIENSDFLSSAFSFSFRQELLRYSILVFAAFFSSTTLPMTVPDSDLIKVSNIQNAGRGVIASKSISKDTIILQSERPVAHVIFSEYRKEVCAQCFFYDLGRKLPVRNNDTGKFFCSADCERQWLDWEGELGSAAWTALHTHVQSKRKASDSDKVMLLEGKPDPQAIQDAWTHTEFVRQRGSFPKGNMNAHVPRTGSVNVNEMSYFLSATLCFYRHPDKWRKDVLNLAMDPTPYADRLDLQTHCNSFIQLASIIPSQLKSCCTVELYQELMSATSHNSFGIRAGSDDGEEYMGYALYPDASYFNHSCSPNVAKKRVGATWEFRAFKDIVGGEECCITYLGGDEDDLTVTARRARLKMHWGFECMCERCVGERQE